MKRNLLILLITIVSFAKGQITSVDNTFGINGIFEQNENSSLWDNSKIIQIADGSIYLSKQRKNSSNNHDNLLIKLTPNGVLDNSFGTNGEVNLGDYPADNGFGMRVQTDGKILLAGGITDTKVYRFLSNGQPDTSFGTNGCSTIMAWYTNDTLGSQNIVLQGDKIIIFSEINTAKNVLRLNADGSLDNSFGVNGKISTFGKQVFVDSQSQLVIIGYNSGTQYTIEKYDSNGQPLNSFGANGKLIVTTPVNFDNIFVAFMDKNDNIIFSSDSDNQKIFKIKSDGTFDNSFVYDFSLFNVVPVNFFEANGLYYFGGTKVNSAGDPLEFFISAINSNGSTNNSFNYYLDPNPNLKYVECIIINPNNIIASGTYNDGTIGKKIVTKYNMTTLNTHEGKNYRDVVFENPISNKLSFTSEKKIIKIEIYSIDGKLVKTVLKNNEDISGLVTGTYLSKVYLEDNEVQVKKLEKR